MQIVRTRKYQSHLIEILTYISKDKVRAALDFRNSLDAHIQTIPEHSQKYRRSIYFDDDNIRDMIFKKYTIVYEIDIDHDQIVIFDIFNKNKR